MSTEQTEAPEDHETVPTDVKALAAALRSDMKNQAIQVDGEELPWGVSEELKSLADRYWHSPEELIIMIVCDWLAYAERHPEIFDRVFGAGPGAGLSMVEAESEAGGSRGAAPANGTHGVRKTHP